MFDGIPPHWEPKPIRHEFRDPWPLHAVITIVVLTLAVYAVKALALVL